MLLRSCFERATFQLSRKLPNIQMANLLLGGQSVCLLLVLLGESDEKIWTG